MNLPNMHLWVLTENALQLSSAVSAKLNNQNNVVRSICANETAVLRSTCYACREPSDHSYQSTVDVIQHPNIVFLYSKT